MKKSNASLGRQFYFDSVIDEQEIDGMRADLLAYKNDTRLIIEIFYRHKVDEDKNEKIIKSCTSAIEIDLSDLTSDEVKDWDSFWLTLNDSKRSRWLFNVKEQEIRNELELKVNHDILKQEKKYQWEEKKIKIQEEKDKPIFLKAIEEFIALKDNAQIGRLKHEAEMHHASKYYKNTLNISLDEIPHFLNVEVPDGDYIYGCDRRIWQSAFCSTFIWENFDERQCFSVQRVDAWLKNTARCKVPECIVNIGKYSSRYPGFASENPLKHIPSSWKTLHFYFEYLCERGMLIYSGNDSRYRGSYWFQIISKVPKKVGY